MRREFLPRTEPYHQSKLYANCQSSLTIVVLTEIMMMMIIIIIIQKYNKDYIFNSPTSIFKPL